MTPSSLAQTLCHMGHSRSVNTRLIIIMCSLILFQSICCKLFLAMFHYTLMANYCWILMEGLYLHSLVFHSLGNDPSSISKYTVMGWGWYHLDTHRHITFTNVSLSHNNLSPRKKRSLDVFLWLNRLCLHNNSNTLRRLNLKRDRKRWNEQFFCNRIAVSYTGVF